MSWLPKISPNVTAGFDVTKAATTAGKLQSGETPDNPTSLQKAGNFGAITSIAQGLTGGIVHAVTTNFPTFAASNPHPLTVVNTLKTSVGVIPASINIATGLVTGDKIATGLGVGGLITATGGMRLAENLAQQSSSAIVKAAPPYFKAAIAVGTIAYGLNTIATNLSKSSPPPDGR